VTGGHPRSGAKAASGGWGFTKFLASLRTGGGTSSDPRSGAKAASGGWGVTGGTSSDPHPVVVVWILY